MSTQYSLNSILRYESIFGEDFISPGGAALMQEQCARIKLSGAPHILDIGSGLGGAAFYFEKQQPGSAVRTEPRWPSRRRALLWRLAARVARQGVERKRKR